MTSGYRPDLDAAPELNPETAATNVLEGRLQAWVLLEESYDGSRDSLSLDEPETTESISW